MTCSGKHLDPLEIADLFQRSAVLMYANSIGLFDFLARDRAVIEISTYFNIIDWKANILLNALVALGLLEHNGAMLSLTPLSRLRLVSTSEQFIGDSIEHERLQWGLWASMHEIMQSHDSTNKQQESRLRGEAMRVFHNAMYQQSITPSEIMSSQITLNDGASIVDLMGGHGYFLIALAKKFPTVKGEVWDLPEAREFCESLISRYGMTTRIIFRDVDVNFLEQYVHEKHDLILIHHCLHHFRPAVVRHILHSVRDILKPSGEISILEPSLDETATCPELNAMFSLYMTMNRAQGGVHRTCDLVSILEELRFSVAIRELKTLDEDTWITARKLS